MSEAMHWATKMSEALAKKLPDHKFYPRLHEGPEMSFVEIGVRGPGKSAVQEEAVAYSVPFFEAFADKDERSVRGKRIYKDVRLVLGLPAEERVPDEG